MRNCDEGCGYQILFFIYCEEYRKFCEINNKIFTKSHSNSNLTSNHELSKRSIYCAKICVHFLKHIKYTSLEKNWWIKRFLYLKNVFLHILIVYPVDILLYFNKGSTYNFLGASNY